MSKSIKLFYLSVSVMLPALSSPSAYASEFEVENFKSGLVCPFHPNMEGGWVCFETETVHMTGRSECNYGGEYIPCSWYGFEFEYKNAPKDTQLQCQTVHDTPGNFGNPRGTLSESTRTFEYNIDIKAGDGRFYNPQYSGIYPQSMTGKVTRMDTRCRYNGREVLSYRMELIYPNALK